MPITIKCNRCQNEIEITQAIRDELEEKILLEIEAKHKKEIKRLELEKQILLEAKKKEIEKIKKELLTRAREEAIKKVRAEYDSKIESTKAEYQEKERQNKELQEEIKALFKQLREIKGAKDKLEVEYQKKLFEEEEKIRQKTKKEVEEELSLELAKKDKQLLDLQKQLKETQRKLQQGSQQLQGEILELKLEDILKKEFPFDKIEEVPKGIRGADVIQRVRTDTGLSCGKILWELKNTKNWSSSWIQKLKGDQRSLKAELSVLVSKIIPENIQGFGVIDEAWIADIKSAVSLAHALRQQLIKVYSIRVANKDRTNKAEIVYGYLTSNEFKQRIEVWVEYFRDRRKKLEKEKAYFFKKWQEEEKSIMKVIENTAGIYGDLQGLIGNALPKVRYLELPEKISR